MRVVFTCDLHGRRHLYEEAFGYALVQGARCIVIGGDLLPTKLKRPYKLITGDFDFLGALHAQFTFIDSFLAPFLELFSRNHPDICILYVPGNHDWLKAIEYLKDTVRTATCLHMNSETIDGMVFTGYGCVTDSPFWVKDFVRRDTRASTYVPSRYPLMSTENGIEISQEGAYAVQRPSIEEELKSFSLSDPLKTISIFHCPPYSTGLDTLYDGKPIGSRSITEFIREQKPLVSLHGHIHEAPYMSGVFHTFVGPTLAVNPGHHSRQLHAVSFDTDDPAKSLTHRVFGTETVDHLNFDRIRDRYARIIKELFMKSVLMK